MGQAASSPGHCATGPQSQGSAHAQRDPFTHHRSPYHVGGTYNPHRHARTPYTTPAVTVPANCPDPRNHWERGHACASQPSRGILVREGMNANVGGGFGYDGASAAAEQGQGATHWRYGAEKMGLYNGTVPVQRHVTFREPHAGYDIYGTNATRTHQAKHPRGWPGSARAGPRPQSQSRHIHFAKTQPHLDRHGSNGGVYRQGANWASGHAVHAPDMRSQREREIDRLTYGGLNTGHRSRRGRGADWF